MGINIGNNLLRINIGNNMGLGNNMLVYFCVFLFIFCIFWSQMVPRGTQMVPRWSPEVPRGPPCVELGKHICILGDSREYTYVPQGSVQSISMEA